MSGTVQSYLDQVASQHQLKPNFMATLGVTLSAPVQVQQMLLSLINYFDIDQAYGQGLDIIGEWVGVSRQVKVPIAGVFFTWGGTASDGWGGGIWLGSYDPSVGINILLDDVYLQLIKGRIAANSWDGTTEGAYDAWNIAFPDIPIVIQDYEDMNMAIGIYGSPISAITKALLTGNYIQLKPEGVGLQYFFTTVDAPLFGWGINIPGVQGWGTGAWGSNT